MGMGNVANSGMQAAMSNMDVISNNIANANTNGFKKSRVSFSDIFPGLTNVSGNGIGLGVKLAGIEQNFQSGGVVNTGTPSDLSIGGNGFFILKDAVSGGLTYTRLGNFNFDLASGSFMIGNQRLQGFPAVNNAIPSGSSPSDLKISTSPMPARASTQLSVGALNLNSQDAIPSVSPFDPNNTNTYNFTTTSKVYDSLGNANTLQLYYSKSASNTWDVQVYANGAAIGTGSLTFSSSGQLTSSTGLSGLTFNPGNGAAAVNFSINMAAATQFSSQDSSLPFVADGYPAGTFSGYQIDKNGAVTALYSNGESIVAGQVAVADFQSPQNLQNAGSSSWIATSGSGQPVVNIANSYNNIQSGALELSNVDLTTEMVNLINAQSSFQANAQVEQVYNQIMQTVTKL